MHQAAHALAVDRLLSAMQLGGDAPIAIGGPLTGELLDAVFECRVIAGLWLIIIAAAREVQDITNQANRILVDQLHSYDPFLLGRAGKSNEAFFAISSCKVSWPTKRSSCAIRARSACCCSSAWK